MGDSQVLLGELLLWGQLELTLLGEQKNGVQTVSLTFRKKKLNLAEIPVPQFEMGILTFALLGQHDQMRCSGPSYGLESITWKPGQLLHVTGSSSHPLSSIFSCVWGLRSPVEVRRLAEELESPSALGALSGL